MPTTPAPLLTTPAPAPSMDEHVLAACTPSERATISAYLAICKGTSAVKWFALLGGRVSL